MSDRGTIILYHIAVFVYQHQCFTVAVNESRKAGIIVFYLVNNGVTSLTLVEEKLATLQPKSVSIGTTMDITNLTVKLCITLADCFYGFNIYFIQYGTYIIVLEVRNIVKSADFVSGAAFKVSRAKEFSIFLSVTC